MMEFEYNGAHHLWARNTRLLCPSEGRQATNGSNYERSSWLWHSEEVLTNLPWRFLGLETEFCYTCEPVPRESPVKDWVRTPTRGKSVKDDWRAWLPEAKAHVFRDHVHQLESNYVMLSVSLDEAIELEQLGQPGKSQQAVGITSSLCKLLTQTLGGLLRALSEHAKHYGTIPNAVPLDPANFQGQRGQRSARMSSLLNHVLLSQRLQFLHKLSTLEEMVEDLGKDFRHAADDLAEGASLNPPKMWAAVDAGHYDLNTCLREAIVVFKSFLIALPEDQLGAFQNAVREQSQFNEPASLSRSSVPS